MPAILDYETPKLPATPSWLLVAAALLFLAGLVLAEVAPMFMNQERLHWEGGGDYYNAHFPFGAVFALHTAGTLAGTAACLHKARGARWRLATILTILNIMAALHWRCAGWATSAGSGVAA